MTGSDLPWLRAGAAGARRHAAALWRARAAARSRARAALPTWAHVVAKRYRRVLVGMIASAAAAALAIGVLARVLPLPDPLFDAPYSAVLLARDGTLLDAHVASDGQWRFPAGATVPTRLARALVRAEDKRFYAHPGVDPIALTRAIVGNLVSGRVVSGASTLSMQVIRLARGNPARTYLEKLREVWLVLALERTHTKDEILALYTAHAPFGGNVVGLEAAAWRHFGHAASDLSWGEAALLAVLPRAPGELHPTRHRERLRARRDALLERLRAAGEIDDVELALARTEPLPGRPLPLPSRAPHLLATLMIERGDGAGRLETTIDPDVQSLAVARVERHARELRTRGVRNASALVLDTRTLDVLAYVGNTTGDASEMAGHAVDVVRAPRSTGSLLKPFLYAGMLQDGSLLPDMLVPDIPTLIAGYRPENYDRRFRGAVAARDALARSLNVPAVRLLRSYGVGRFKRLLSDLGMSTLWRRAEDYGLTLVLGGAEGTLWEMAGMYASLGRLAMQPELSPDIAVRTPRVLRERSSRDARTSGDTPGTHPDARPAARSEIGPGAAWLTLDALRHVTRPSTETGWQELRGRPIAWKTGTSFGLRDAWAIGVTPTWTVAVWVGNASGEGVPGLTGTDAAAPILFSILRAAPASGWIDRPHWDLSPVEVCRDDGYLATPLCEAHTAWVPRDSRPRRTSPHHRRVFLDASGAWQVHAGCESLASMRAETRLVLPAIQERYYRAQHPDHRSVPPMRADCADDASAASARGDIALVYPEPGSRIHIPRELGGERSRAVLVAVHRDPDATLYWHLDGDYLGATREIHRWPLLAAPGRHRLTLVDESGRTIERDLEVMDETGSTPGPTTTSHGES